MAEGVAGEENAVSTQFRWATDNQRIMLEFYKQHQFLFQPKHPDYKKKSLHRYTLAVLSETFGGPVPEITSKFHALRTYFNKEYAKVKASKRSGASTDNVYTPKWELYADMLFVKGVGGPRSSVDSLDCTAPNMDFYSQEGVKGESSQQCASDSDVQGSSPPQPPRRKKKKAESQPIREGVFLRALQILKDGDDVTSESAFGATVVHAMQGIDEVRKDLLKLKIMELIFQFKYNAQVIHSTDTM
ncbi:uncharacterized protein LOC135397912 [Ornithodoros turicata]|uniref:uncharacterized protein LOC135397912 n=1 Tax=Ornithodoros turicata TaxID=34597 RepID=UPI00313A4C28